MNPDEQRTARKKLMRPLIAVALITTAGLAFVEFGSKKETSKVTVYSLPSSD